MSWQVSFAPVIIFNCHSLLFNWQYAQCVVERIRLLLLLLLQVVQLEPSENATCHILQWLMMFVAHTHTHTQIQFVLSVIVCRDNCKDLLLNTHYYYYHHYYFQISVYLVASTVVVAGASTTTKQRATSKLKLN